MITIDNVTYNDDDAIDFDTAIEFGGFYFSRAKYLNLPKPPACFVADIDEPSESQINIIGRYHALFREREADLSSADLDNAYC